MPLAWCFYTAGTDQQELVLSFSILWLKDPYLLFLLLKSELPRSPRQDPATAPSFCSYGNVLESSG